MDTNLSEGLLAAVSVPETEAFYLKNGQGTPIKLPNGTQGSVIEVSEDRTLVRIFCLFGPLWVKADALQQA